MSKHTGRIKVETEGGVYIANIPTFEHALTLGKKRLARDMAEALSSHGQRRAEATKTYWMQFPVAILAVIWCDAYHGHNKGDACDVCYPNGAPLGQTVEPCQAAKLKHFSSCTASASHNWLVGDTDVKLCDHHSQAFEVVPSFCSGSEHLKEN